MQRNHIGELEELVLLAVGSLRDEAYAVTILKVIVEHTGRKLDVTAVHSVLRRLEKKGYRKLQNGRCYSSKRWAQEEVFYALGLR